MRVVQSFTRRKGILTVAVAAVGALSLSAGAFAVFGARSDGSVTPIDYGRPTSSASARSGDLNSALSQALKNMNGSSILDASLGDAPAGANSRGLPWLRVEVALPALREGLDIRPQWDADLLEGAVLDSAGTATQQRETLGGSTFDGRLPDGRLIADIGGGLGDVVQGQTFDPVDDASISDRVAAVLESYGLREAVLEIEHPLGAAPMVVATTSDPSAILGKMNGLLGDLFGQPPTFEGYYLEIRDGSGKAVLRTSAAFRTGAGRLWVDPSHESDLRGITHG